MPAWQGKRVMWEITGVAVGGALGALARYGVITLAAAWWGKGFPWGVLIANLSGSFLIGVLGMLFLERAWLSEAWRVPFLVGVLGAFTTFSAFSWDTLTLFQNGAMIRAVLNVVANVVFCLLAAWCGMVFARTLLT